VIEKTSSTIHLENSKHDEQDQDQSVQNKLVIASKSNNMSIWDDIDSNVSKMVPIGTYKS